jgi:hypothetical protein
MSAAAAERLTGGEVSRAKSAYEVVRRNLIRSINVYARKRAGVPPFTGVNKSSYDAANLSVPLGGYISCRWNKHVYYYIETKGMIGAGNDAG